MSEQVYDEILKWVTAIDDTPSDLRKHAPLNEFLLTNAIKVQASEDARRALVVGGSKAVIEQSVLRDVGFEFGEIVCIDRVEPQESEFLGTNRIAWLDGLFPAQIPPEQVPPADALICLAASRLFPDAFDTYAKLIPSLRGGALVIIDFLHQPVMRRAAIEALRGWVFAEWERDRERAMATMEDLARVSVAMGERLDGCEVNITSNTADVGLVKGTYPVQRILYEILFPFWYRPGAQMGDALRQMVWQLLYRSMDGTEDRVRTFAAAHRIAVIGVLSLTPDTNVLVGRTAS